MLYGTCIHVYCILTSNIVCISLQCNVTPYSFIYPLQYTISYLVQLFKFKKNLQTTKDFINSFNIYFWWFDYIYAYQLLLLGKDM